MPDPRFFRPAGPFSLAALAEIAGATLLPAANRDRTFSGVAALGEATPGDVAFLDNRRYLKAFADTKAGCCLVEPRYADKAAPGTDVLVTDKPYKGFALIAQAFYPDEAIQGGVHPRATVDPAAKVDPTARIDAGVVVGARAEIGPRCWLGPNAVVGDGVVIEADTVVGACAVLQYCLIGKRVLIHPGVCIGNRGFGFAIDPQGHVRIPQVGRVIVEDDVEIGANTAIDRGMGPDTVIGRGSMIDNLVMIGHNARLGRGCIVVGQAGISGSTKLGNYVVLAAGAGLAGHLTIGDGARIAAKAGVMRDLGPGEAVGGAPAVPLRQWHRQTVALGRLAKGKANQEE
jgi:UDP-3-O-[3-hydroxymyristoyl] glucosamine N-acyltransferase